MADKFEKNQKHFEKLFEKEVLPAVKDQVAAANLARSKKDSLNERLTQNQKELERLTDEITLLRSEFSQQILSGKKGDEYAQEVSRIKTKISMLKDVQNEIKEHLLPEVESQLENAYSDLAIKANGILAGIANKMRDDLFDIMKDSLEKAQGYEMALSTFSKKILGLPGSSHQLRLDLENIPILSGVEGIVSTGRWWDELYGQRMN
jgi:uncharacterized coiled-coil DUF342 family protein